MGSVSKSYPGKSTALVFPIVNRTNNHEKSVEISSMRQLRSAAGRRAGGVRPCVIARGWWVGWYLVGRQTGGWPSLSHSLLAVSYFGIRHAAFRIMQDYCNSILIPESILSVRNLTPTKMLEPTPLCSMGPCFPPPNHPNLRWRWQTPMPMPTRTPPPPPRRTTLTHARTRARAK